jgi:hypothetical protein
MGFNDGGATRIGPMVSLKSGSRQSSMLRRLGCGGAKLEAGLDALEGGGAHDTFYRARGVEERTVAADSECSFKAIVF